jgi:hypothetical protein
MTIRRGQSILLMFLVLACVERIDVPVAESQPSLVVDGMLTDQPGPHTVTLTLSSAVSDERVVDVNGATVEILVSSGHIEGLQEISPGQYQTTDTFRGVLGESYQLRVQTAWGTYQSEMLEMLPAGEIENLFAVYRENSINQNDPSKPHDAIDVYLDGIGQPGQPNLLRWRWTGTYYVITFPQFRVRNTEGGPVPDPFPCSGYVSQGGQLVYVRPCECCECWVTDYSQNGHVSDNNVISGGDFKSVFITRVPVDNWRFIDKYHIEVEQLSVSSDVHRFWKLVQVQQESAGNIFQPNVVQVEGNVASLTNPDEAVFGVFSVSAVTRSIIVLDRSYVPNPVPQLDTAIADCRYFFDNSTNVKPPFW